MIKRGRPRKKRLIDLIPADLREAVRWIRQIAADYKERMRHTPGPNSQKQKQEIIEAWDEIDRRVEAHNQEVLKIRQEAELKRKIEQAHRERYGVKSEEQIKREQEAQERYNLRKIWSDDPDYWN